MKLLVYFAVIAAVHSTAVTAISADSDRTLLVESSRRSLQTVFGNADESTGNAGCVNDEQGRDVCTLNFDIGFPGTERSVDFSLMLICPNGWASDTEASPSDCSSCEVTVEGKLCTSCEICSSSSAGDSAVASARSAQPYAFNCQNVLNAEYTQAGIDCNGVSVGAGQGSEAGDISSAPIFMKAGLTAAVMILVSLL